MDDLLQLGKEALASQPFSVLVGAELTGYSPGWAELTVAITPQLKQQHGFVHGGVVSYAADNALTFVGQAVCRCDVFMVDESKETLCAVAQGTIARIGRSTEPQGQEAAMAERLARG
jgi:acyl-coenzyme A thioesterase PaaI-like protein